MPSEMDHGTAALRENLSDRAYQYCSECGRELEIRKRQVPTMPNVQYVYLECPKARTIANIFFVNRHDTWLIRSEDVTRKYNRLTGERNKK